MISCLSTSYALKNYGDISEELSQHYGFNVLVAYAIKWAAAMITLAVHWEAAPFQSREIVANAIIWKCFQNTWAY